MIDIDKADEQTLRRFIVENGVPDFEFVSHIHPMSAGLREKGHNAEADALDDYYKKVNERSMGQSRVLTLDEVKAKAKEIQERMDAK